MPKWKKNPEWERGEFEMPKNFPHDCRWTPVKKKPVNVHPWRSETIFLLVLLLIAAGVCWWMHANVDWDRYWEYRLPLKR